jgi:hypothetical protein
MTDEKRITVRSKPLVPTEGDDQSAKAIDVAICTKDGMNVRVRSPDMVVPDTECYFYVKLDLPWKRPDGSDDYEEIITDGDNFYIAFRSLGKQRLKWTEAIQNIIIQAIQKFVEELSK